MDNDKKDLAVLNEKIEHLEAQVISVQKQDNRLEDSLFAPDKARHYQGLAQQLAGTALVPKAYQGKPMELFLAMAMGYKIGLSVEQAMQDIAVINGRPTVWGDALLAIVKSQPDFVDMTEVPIMNGNLVEGYVCTIKRKGQTPVSREFTLQDAKKAGLLNRQGPWTQYRERMLQMRARGFAARDSFPDALKGIKCREEVEDYIEGEFEEVKEPKSKAELIKQDWANKQGMSDDAINEKVNAENDDTKTEEKTKGGNESIQVESAGKQEATVDTKAKEDGLITIPLIKEIKSLIKEKGVEKERVAKALKHYKTDSIEDMRMTEANDFIDNLKRMDVK